MSRSRSNLFNSKSLVSQRAAVCCVPACSSAEPIVRTEEAERQRPNDPFAARAIPVVNLGLAQILRPLAQSGWPPPHRRRNPDDNSASVEPVATGGRVTSQVTMAAGDPAILPMA